MRELGFAFNNMDFSDMVLRIEIVSEKNFMWLKSLLKRIPFPYIHAAVDLESTTYVRVLTLNINSRILASESLYFYKLFENVTKESDKKEVTLNINASEEAALMDLLNFMYINNLSATTPSELEGVRMIAEKLEVTSCMKYVKKLSMSLQHELYYGEPSFALMAEEVQPLKDAAKKYLIERHRDLTESWIEARALPLSALEIVLGSPGIQVESENELFYFIEDWVLRRAHFFEIMVKRLSRFVYYPYMTLSPGHNLSHNVVLHSLLDSTHLHNGFPYARAPQIRRAYKYHPIKVMLDFEAPLTNRVVYFFLTKQDLENLFRSKRQDSRRFSIHNLVPRLVAKCNKVEQSSSYHFGLFVCMCRSEFSDYCKFEYEFAVLTKKLSSSEEEYKIMSKVDNCTISESEDLVGKENLFGMTWADLMADDSVYLVDGILHLRVEINLNK